MKEFTDFLKKAGDKIEGMFKTSVEAQDKLRESGNIDEDAGYYSEKLNKSVINTAKDAYEAAKPTIKIAEEWLKNDFESMLENHQKAKEEYDAKMDEYAKQFGTAVRGTEEYKWLEENASTLAKEAIEQGLQKVSELIETMKHGIEIYQLNQAIYEGKVKLVESMITENKLDVNWITSANEHPMLVALKMGDEKIIKALEEAHIDCTKCIPEMIKMVKDGDSNDPENIKKFEMLKDIIEYNHNEMKITAGITDEKEMTTEEVEHIEEVVKEEDSGVKPAPLPTPEPTVKTTGEGDQVELKTGGDEGTAETPVDGDGQQH